MATTTTTQYTMEMYATLCAGLAQGALRVKYGDKEVDYRTLADMRSIKAEMETALGLRKQNNGRRLISFKRGF